LESLVEKIRKALIADPDEIFYHGEHYAYGQLTKRISKILDEVEKDNDICPKCDGSGYVKHECNPKHVKTLIPYKTNGLDETIYISRCICGKYFWEKHELDPGAGDSHECISISEELANSYIDEKISGFYTPERKSN